MGIRFNQGCCCSPLDLPAWTVYHNNVSAKLHTYKVHTYVNGLPDPAGNWYLANYFFYDSESGSEVTYKACFPFVGASNLIIERVGIALTGVYDNSWIMAGKIKHLSMSGYDNIGSYNFNLNYTPNTEAYVFGRHYCDYSGFSGSLTGTVDDVGISSLHVYPFVAGKVASKSPILDIVFSGVSGQIDGISDAIPYDNFSYYHAFSGNNTSSSFGTSTGVLDSISCPPFGGTIEKTQSICSGTYYGSTFNSYSYFLDVFSGNFTYFYNCYETFTGCLYRTNPKSFFSANEYNGYYSGWTTNDELCIPSSTFGCAKGVKLYDCIGSGSYSDCYGYSFCNSDQQLNSGISGLGFTFCQADIYGNSGCQIRVSEHPVLSDVHLYKIDYYNSLIGANVFPLSPVIISCDSGALGALDVVITATGLYSYFVMNPTGNTRRCIDDLSQSDYMRVSLGDAPSCSQSYDSGDCTYTLSACGAFLVFHNKLYVNKFFNETTFDFDIIQSNVVDSDLC